MYVVCFLVVQSELYKLLGVRRHAGKLIWISLITSNLLPQFNLMADDYIRKLIL